MRLTTDQLRRCWTCNVETAQKWVDPLNTAMSAFVIDTPRRQAAFLAQIGHESGRGRYVREIWGPTPAQSRYEGRADLGNTQPGDGKRYMGHGLIQITGRANHAGVTAGLRASRLPGAPEIPDFEATPQALEAPQWAAYSAALFWSQRGLNALADLGDFERITRKINGGLNGQEDRLALHTLAKAVLGAV